MCGQDWAPHRGQPGGDREILFSKIPVATTNFGSSLAVL